jgi:hypothetical protein
MEFEYRECPYARRAFNERGELITLACDRWSCPFCRQVLAWRWASRVRFGIDLAQPRDPLFWTLTLPARIVSPEWAYRKLPGLWANIRQALRREFGSFPYCAFVEGQPHRNDMPHFHLITFRWPHKRLKDLAVHCGFGFEADISQINGPAAARYVSKYASKQPRAMPRNFRRVRVSRDWPKLPTPLYGLTVLYPKPRESVPTYVRRVAVALDEDYNLLMSRWLS